jgi:hypothetical protein
MAALRELAETPEELPTLFHDPVNPRVQPVLLTSNCFEVGMMEKGFFWRDPELIWLHYEMIRVEHAETSTGVAIKC